MRATDEDYRNQLLALAPVGHAWSRDPDAQFPRLIHGVASELARVHNRALDLVEEADPQTTDEMLQDWERVVGFPDPCVPLPSETEARRTAVVGRLAARGGQSAAYYTTLCAAFGYDVTITDYRPLVMGVGACGEMIHSGDGQRFTMGASVMGESLEVFDWNHAWRLDGEPSISRYFIMGESAMGQSLGERDNPQIRCLIERLKPEHTRVGYTWNGLDPREEFPDVSTSDPSPYLMGASCTGMPLGSVRTVVLSHGAAPLIVYAGAAQSEPVDHPDVSVSFDADFVTGDGQAGTPLGYLQTITFTEGQAPATTFE